MSSSSAGAREFRWGIMGSGLISSDFVHALGHVPGARVTAVAARSLSKAKEFAAKHSIPAAFGSYEDLSRAADVDIVYVGTIHPAHFECAKTAITHGKSVLCEKPMCMTATEAAALVKLAKAHNVFLMEGMWTRFFPAVVSALDLVREGKIGDVVEVISDFGFASKVSESSRLYNLDMGGGGLLDIGIYVIASAAFVWGCEPVDVRAVGWREPTGADSCGVLALKYGTEADGGPPRIASLTYSMRTLTKERTIYQGTRGKITLRPSHCPTKMKLEVDGEEPVTKHFDLPKPSSRNFTNSSGFVYEIERVHALLAAGATECPEWSLKTAVDMARLLDTVRTQLGVVYTQHDGLVTRVLSLSNMWPISFRVASTLLLVCTVALTRGPRS